MLHSENPTIKDSAPKVIMELGDSRFTNNLKSCSLDTRQIELLDLCKDTIEWFSKSEYIGAGKESNEVKNVLSSFKTVVESMIAEESFSLLATTEGYRQVLGIQALVQYIQYSETDVGAAMTDQRVNEKLGDIASTLGVIAVELAPNLATNEGATEHEQERVQRLKSFSSQELQVLLKSLEQTRSKGAEVHSEAHAEVESSEGELSPKMRHKLDQTIWENFSASAEACKIMVDQGLANSPYEAAVRMYDGDLSWPEIEEIFTKVTTDRLQLMMALDKEGASLVAERQDNTPLHEIEITDTESGKQITHLLADKLGIPREMVTFGESNMCFSILPPVLARLDVQVSQIPFAEVASNILHEGGHLQLAMGLPRDSMDKVSGADRVGNSMVLDEAMARLFEVCVGCSVHTWTGLKSNELEEIVPELKHLSASDIARQLIAPSGKLRPSRTDTDPLSNFAHLVPIRVGLEKKMIEMEPDELKNYIQTKLEADWNELCEQHLGFMPDLITDGAFENSHWFDEFPGYFAIYPLADLVAAQLYEAALKQNPGIIDEISEGTFTSLASWLKQEVSDNATKMSLSQIVESATGQSLDSGAYMRLHWNRYAHHYPSLSVPSEYAVDEKNKRLYA